MYCDNDKGGDDGGDVGVMRRKNKNFLNPFFFCTNRKKKLIWNSKIMARFLCLVALLAISPKCCANVKNTYPNFQ